MFTHKVLDTVYFLVLACIKYFVASAVAKFQVLELQNLLIWAKMKQMVLIGRNDSDHHNTRNQIKGIQGSVDKRHHPILMLRQLTPSTMTQSVMCRGASVAININHFTDGHWLLPTRPHAHVLERRVCAFNYFFIHRS